MSDPASELRPALATWLRNDTEVRAAFGASTPQVFAKLPPINSPEPYIFIAGLLVRDDLAECIDAAEVDVQIDVWSLTVPPGFAEAERIAAAVKTSLARLEDNGDSPTFSLSNFRVVSSQAISTTYLTDPSDGKTVHAVIAARLSVDPI